MRTFEKYAKIFRILTFVNDEILLQDRYQFVVRSMRGSYEVDPFSQHVTLCCKFLSKLLQFCIKNFFAFDGKSYLIEF